MYSPTFGTYSTKSFIFKMLNHEFDWDGVRVLDEEMNYKKRLISEMIHIKKQKHGLNSQNDDELLDPIYNNLLLCKRK